jgi:hypothetical protein
MTAAGTSAAMLSPMKPSTPSKEPVMKIKRTLGCCAVALTLAGSAGATFLSGAGTALAPEPAKLVASLSGGTGATAAGVYVNTQAKTSVVLWGTSSVYAPNGPAAGTPCSPGYLAANSQTTMVIQVLALGYRRCAYA